MGPWIEILDSIISFEGLEWTLIVCFIDWNMEQICTKRSQKMPQLPWYTIEEGLKRLMELGTIEWICNVRPAHPHRESPEENIIIQWTRWPILCLLVILFPQPLLSLPNSLMNEVTILTEIEVRHRLSSMNFYSATPMWLQPLSST